MAVTGFVLSGLTVLPTRAPAQEKRDVKKDTKKARQAADKARVALGRRDYRVALDQYSQAVQLDPTNADYRFWKGASHYYLNEYALALPDLDAAQSMGYKKPLELYTIRWFSNFKEKKYDAALADIRQGLTLDPNNLDLLQGLGDISYENRNFAEAIDAYQKVAAGKPNIAADLYYYIARSHSNLGNHSAQVTAAEEAVKRRTQFLGEANALIGDGYRKARRFDEAIAAYRKAIAAKPNIYSAYENLADVYRDQNRFTEAIDISRRALEVFPNDGRIYTSLSWFYSLAGRNEEAIQAAQAGIRFLPDQYMAYTNLCRAYNDVNKPEMAIRECNNALKRNPNDGETYFYLARANDLVGKSDEATKHYKRALVGLVELTKANPDSSEGFYLLGNAYFADNQPEKAIDAYQKCLALSPRFVKARYNIAIIQLRQKNKTAALEQYNRLLELDPQLAGKLKAEIDKS